MRFLKLIFGILAATTTLAAPVDSGLSDNAAGHVVNNHGKVYLLEETGAGNIHRIMNRSDSAFTKPVRFHVELGYQCKLYSVFLGPGTFHGIGDLIGTYTGSYNGTFGDNWAGYYECSRLIQVAARTDELANRKNPLAQVVNGQGHDYKLQDTGAGHILKIKQPDSYDTRALSFDIDAHARCSFYEYDYIGGGNGVGDLLGTWTGNYAGDFGSRWAASYECYKVKKRAQESDHAIEASEDRLKSRMIPCGYVETLDNKTHMVNEGLQGKMMNFADNGDAYNPVIYHVNTGCHCRFYSAWNGGALQMIEEAIGPAAGNFSCPQVSKYQCWIEAGGN